MMNSAESAADAVQQASERVERWKAKAASQEGALEARAVRF